MQFKPEMIEAIKAGRKTQTRRRSQFRDIIEAAGHRVISVSRNGREIYRVGKRYSVCPGRGKPRVGLIELLAIHSEPLLAISELDSRAEGFENGDAFMAAWKALRPKSDLQEWVWVLEFRLI